MFPIATRATALALAVAGLLLVGGPPSQARAQVDLGDVVEQTQGTLEQAADGALGLVAPSSPSAPAPSGGGERGSVEPPAPTPEPTPSPPPPPPPPGDPGVEPAPEPAPAGGPALASARGGGSTGAPDPPARTRNAGPPRAREAARENAAPQARPAREQAPSALERIVAVVPTEIKVALATLVVLVIGSLLTTRHARRRLAHAERRAATDALTGLPNRISAEQALERLIAHGRRTASPVSAVIFDLDHFKSVNDNFGHAAGDAALRAVASAARARVRGADHVARFGGEEFLLLLPDTDREGAVTIAEILRTSIAELEVEGPGKVTASFGVASMPANATSPAELLAAADAALYAAKEDGRDCVHAAGEPSAVLAPV